MEIISLQQDSGNDYPAWHELFNYEPETGLLTWKVKRPGRSSPNVGEEAGNVSGRYRSVQHKRKRYYVHRIIWELLSGPIPAGLCIDHIDGDGLNNKRSNLRLTTLSLNQRNRTVNSNNSTGIAGVHRHRGGFSVYCASRYIGWTKDFFEACCMRRSTESRMGYINRSEAIA